MKFQLMLINVVNRFLGGEGGSSTVAGSTFQPSEWGGAPTWIQNMIKPIFDILAWLLPIIMILLGVAGAIYIIIVGVQYAKAENADEKDQAKKKLINIAVALIIMLVSLIVVFIFIKNAPAIFKWTADQTTTT